jgi:hypothetical protein
MNGNENAAAPAIQKLKLQAARGGKKPSRANSAKPNGRWEKRPPPSAEDLAEEQKPTAGANSSASGGAVAL